MVIDLLDKLVDRCIQLVRHKEAVHRRLFEEYVEPMQDDFEAIHQDYLESFRKYRAMVKASAPLNAHHPVFDAITEDALFNAKSRMRISAATRGVSDPRLEGFVRSVQQYFHKGGIPDYDLISNAPRENTLQYLKDIVRSSTSAKGKKEAAIELLDGTVRTLQRSYAWEHREFSRLKKALLRVK